jgi:ElaA protein
MWITKAYAELGLDELYDLLQLRNRVFVVEQQAAYLDCDGKDKKAHHLLLLGDLGEVIAYARLLPPGVSYLEAAIGRVVVDPAWRGRGLAHDLMRLAIPQCLALFGVDRIRISAQKHLQGFYGQHGFRPFGADYLEDGIPHVAMLYEKAGQTGKD